MKKLLVVSDNHFQEKELTRILQQYADIDYFIHCGDSQWDLDEPLLKNFTVVRGNNDFVRFPEEEVLNVEARKVLITHGHRQNVFNDEISGNFAGITDLVTYALNEYEANVIFYGHTHIPEMHIDRGVFVLNPGSINFPRSRRNRLPSYAIVTIDKLEITANFYHAQTHEDITKEIMG